MDMHEAARLLEVQDGVIARRQVLAIGGTDNDIERLLRRREWASVHPGTYADHTGPPSWRQRARAAVLHHGPAALAGSTALLWVGVRGVDADGPIELVVPRTRCVVPARGIVVRRLSAYDDQVLDGLDPPRVTLEHAVLDLASRAATADAAVARVADACQTRRTTPARLVSALEGLSRLPRRRLLREILQDVATGTCSALERRYLVDVEPAHGLPTASRQRRVRPGRAAAYRDVEYLRFAMVVELDGRLGHEAAGDRWADLERDIAAVLGCSLTVRAGWQQVLDPCRLAGALARLLRGRGWAGEIRRCGLSCRPGLGA